MTKKSYIKIYGPPVLEAIEALENLSIDMPEVCIMNPIIYSIPDYNERFQDLDQVRDYFSNVRSLGEIELEQCDKLISKTGDSLGEYDFFFEWFVDPDSDQVKQLIKKIDETIKPLGCSYTITTLDD